MTNLSSTVDPSRLACHDKEIQSSTFKGGNARNNSDNHNKMTTIEYHKPEHSNVPSKQVLDYIAENISSIQHVSCRETFNTEAVKELCKILLKDTAQTNVETLSLPRNELDARAAEALAKLLYSNATIRSLDLSMNNLGSDGVSILVQPIESANKKLVSLNLTQNNLGYEGAKSLIPLLKHTRTLQTLKLGDNHLGTRGIKILSPWLASCRSLRTLSLTHNQIKADGVKLLATELRQRKSSLVYLDITCNRAGTGGARAVRDWLFHNRTLRTLVMSSNNCDPEGAYAMSSVLRYNHILKHLNLGGNKLGNAGAEAIAEALNEFHHLESLNLGWNHIKDPGAQALAGALKRNASLVSLELSGNHIGKVGGIALAEALAYNLMLKYLDLSETELEDSAALAFAKALVGANRVFETLDYNGNGRISDSASDRIEQALRYRKERRIWFGRFLQQLDVTTLMDLSSRRIGNEEVIAITNRLVSDTKPPSPLQALYISGDGITARGISYFAKKCLANAESCRLVRLYVRNTRIADEGAVAIANALKTNRSLRVLSLTSSGVTPTGAHSLGNALQENSTLERICLDGNRLGDRGLQEFVNGLPSSLSSLSVANNGITDEGIATIVGKGLREVNLSDNKITDRGALDLLRLLLDDNDPPFERLNLSGNDVTDIGGEGLARFLPPTARFVYM